VEAAEKLWTVQSNDNLDPVITESASLFLQSFLEPGSPDVWSSEYFNWKLGDANPAGTGFMTVAIHQGDVIGVTTITRKRFWDGQKEIPAAEIGDTYSHPSFRREGRSSEPYANAGAPQEYLNRSIFGRLVTETRKRAVESNIHLIYGTPNQNSMPGYVSRLGFFDYQSHYNRYFVRPGIAAVSKRISILRPAAVLFFPVEKILGQVVSGLFGSRRGFRAEELSDPANHADELWQKLRFQMPIGLVRDAVYFKHRFAINPMAKYRFWSVYRADELCGLFVTRTVTHADRLASHHLVEWLIDPLIKGVFRFMASEAVQELGNSKTKSYSCWTESDWGVQQGLKPLGFLARGKVPIIFHKDQQNQKLDESGTKFHFTLATSDNI